MNAQRLRYKNKLPELKNSLNLLDALEEKKGKEESMETNFLLSDQVYSTATIAPTDKVCLWLGANVMLEYSLAEARDLLQRNIGSAEKGIVELTSELDFVKDQLTTTEVNIARVYNHGVQRRKLQAGSAS
uniref:Prefoldin subunit 3 n=2 Tax=Plectus sambesii TaxID=2011161 RepID=A0A914UM49_9BILA